MILFDVVIVSFNTRDLLRECLDALRAQVGATWRAIVVDNASEDGSADMVAASFPEALVIETGSNLGFAGGTNKGLEASSAPFVLLLNSDAMVGPGCLEALAASLEADPRIGLLAARLVNPDGSPQASCVPARFPWAYSSPERDCDLLWASGAALVVRRSCLEAIGGLDEHFFYTGEDYDWGLRARKAGWRVRFTAAARVAHVGAASARNVGKRVQEGLHFGRQYFYRKHFGRVGLAYARLHSTVELVGQASRGSGAERVFFLDLIRRTWAYKP